MAIVHQPFTERQVTIAKFLADGCTYIDIASRLSVSRSTVIYELQKMCDYTDCHNKTQLVYFMAKNHYL